MWRELGAPETPGPNPWRWFPVLIGKINTVGQGDAPCQAPNPIQFVLLIEDMGYDWSSSSSLRLMSMAGNS